MNVLGIETACDDTCVAVVRDGRRILSNVIWSQDHLHAEYGGIVPEVAARRQVEVLDVVLAEALRVSGVTLGDVDAVAVNHKHGLVRSIVVGVAAAKALAFALNVPLVGVHHIEGHLYSALLACPDLVCPFLCLTVAGGHTLLVVVRDIGEYEVLGSTRDDSAGEIFDKIARHLGLGFPGGRIMDELAEQGDASQYPLPRPLLSTGTPEFSFSGLKEAARRTIDRLRAEGASINLEGFAASLRAAVTEVLVTKTLAAAIQGQLGAIAITGGVAANRGLRDSLKREADSRGLRVVIPPIRLCMDNAAMIAGLGFQKLERGLKSDWRLGAFAGGPLDGRVG